MAFWDTVMGNRLAHVLVNELPKLTRGKQQYTKYMPDEDVQEFIETEIQKGNRYVSHISYHGNTTVIMEKY